MQRCRSKKEHFILQEPNEAQRVRKQFNCMKVDILLVSSFVMHIFIHPVGCALL